jgi:putative CocE/NonD family hydrolase
VRQIGGIDFGPRAVLDLDETLLTFFDACLRNDGTTRVTDSRIFVTGRNEWLNADDERFRAGRMLNLHASSTLGANTRCGDGVLTVAAPGRAGVDTMTHNPAVPVEFQPQFRSFAAGANPLGFTLDQSHITAVDEALVYTSEPLDRPITVFGQPRVTLSVRTHACDADLYVLLSDCFPLGAKDLHLSHAAIRLATLPQFRPGEWFKVEVELDRLAHDFLSAHQIRLTVVPSLFPLYARNPQTGAYTSGSECVIADIELQHGYDAPLCLTLPLAGAP